MLEEIRAFLKAMGSSTFIVPHRYHPSLNGAMKYRNGSFIHRINISQMTILVNIRDFIFMNLLAS